MNYAESPPPEKSRNQVQLGLQAAEERFQRRDERKNNNGGLLIRPNGGAPSTAFSERV
jgi:hypothetical protein